jgi:hypothetical protein
MEQIDGHHAQLSRCGRTRISFKTGHEKEQKGEATTLEKLWQGP